MTNHSTEIVFTTSSGERLAADLVTPADALGLVVFAHGSGSSRTSPRNREVAEWLRAAGLGTLLFDLLTADEDAYDQRTARLRFDIPLLASRVRDVLTTLRQTPDLAKTPIGLFGASTGAAAALFAAADPALDVGAVVSRGGRPDLAAAALADITAPTLLVVGGADPEVIDLNREAEPQLGGTCRLEIVPHATHLFEEPGALGRVADLAAQWFRRHLGHQTGNPGRAAAATAATPDDRPRMFPDRRAGGRELGARLAELPELHGRAGHSEPGGPPGREPVVLGLARGGVPVAYEVARALGVPLDVEVVRKIGAPGHPEFGVGAVTAGGTPYYDKSTLDATGLTPEDLAGSCEREWTEGRRRLASYRPDGEPAHVDGRTVVLVDDGLATGVTARAAVAELRRRGARAVVFAAPVCAADSAAGLRSDADQVICVGEPKNFGAVGAWYADFGQTTDDEVRELLGWQPETP